MPEPRADREDDFRDLLEGRIDSQEYVRRLHERVNRRRLFEVDPTPRPWREKTPRDGFWAGVWSVFGGGRRA